MIYENIEFKDTAPTSFYEVQTNSIVLVVDDKFISENSTYAIGRVAGFRYDLTNTIESVLVEFTDKETFKITTDYYSLEYLRLKKSEKIEFTPIDFDLEEALKDLKNSDYKTKILRTDEEIYPELKPVELSELKAGDKVWIEMQISAWYSTEGEKNDKIWIHHPNQSQSESGLYVDKTDLFTKSNLHKLPILLQELDNQITIDPELNRILSENFYDMLEP